MVLKLLQNSRFSLLPTVTYIQIACMSVVGGRACACRIKLTMQQRCVWSSYMKLHPHHDLRHHDQQTSSTLAGDCLGNAAHRERGDALRHVGRGRGPELERAAGAGLRERLVAGAVALAACQRQPAIRAGGLQPPQKVTC